MRKYIATVTIEYPETPLDEQETLIGLAVAMGEYQAWASEMGAEVNWSYDVKDLNPPTAVVERMS